MKTQFILIFLAITSLIYCENNNPKYLFNEVDGYVQISKKTVEFLVDKMNVTIKELSPGQYDYIFQKTPFDSLFVLPYIRIQINEYGRLTKSELEKYGSKYYKYDPTTNYLWQEKNDQLNVIIPTNLGTINVFCYSTKENFVKDKESFKKFINSIGLFPDVKYKASFIRDIPLINDVFYEGKHLTSIIVVISFGIFYLTRNRSKRVVT